MLFLCVLGIYEKSETFLKLVCVLSLKCLHLNFEIYMSFETVGFHFKTILTIRDYTDTPSVQLFVHVVIS